MLIESHDAAGSHRPTLREDPLAGPRPQPAPRHQVDLEAQPLAELVLERHDLPPDRPVELDQHVEGNRRLTATLRVG